MFLMFIKGYFPLTCFRMVIYDLDHLELCCRIRLINCLTMMVKFVHLVLVRVASRGRGMLYLDSQ